MIKNGGSIIIESKMKICTKCKIPKNESEFFKRKTRKGGLRSWCKLCDTKQAKKWEKENSEKRKLLKKIWRETNPKYMLNWNKNNPEKRKEIQKRYYQKNRELIIAKGVINKKTERATSTGALNHRMEVSIKKALKENKNGHTWEKLVGYTLNDLKKHLEKQFKDGMNWVEFTKGKIHIDHKIPKSVFNYSSHKHIDFKRCWALSNLQPMWARDNISKKNKLIKPFQPSLAF